MKHYERYIKKTTVREIQNVIKNNPDISRKKLSRDICKQTDWRSENGKLKEMSCRKALIDMDNRGIISLNKRIEPDAFNFHRTKTVKNDKKLDYNTLETNCDLSELNEIKIVPIKNRKSKDSKVWYDLLDKHHYLGSLKLCGSQIRYVIKTVEDKYIGALGFSSGTFKLKARDLYIGWSDGARRKNIKYIVNNDRFLLVPSVNVNNLFSYTMSKVLARFPQDWEEIYNYQPELIETYVDPTKYKGTGYKASNYEHIGYTAGRRDGISRKIYIYSLNSNWRMRLCREPEIKLGEGHLPLSASNWAEEEFGRTRFYDNRIKKRLYNIAQDFYNSPNANIPEACSDSNQAKAAYRFFKNDKVNMDILIDSHTEATIERIKEHKVVLAPQDTTTLKYSTHPMTENLGPVGRSKSEIGLILHDTMAFTESGTPLGILDAQCWARDPEEFGKKHKRHTLPIEQKESMKWLRSYNRLCEVKKLCPETTLVSIGDRESDIYELFQQTCSISPAPELLVRAEKTRNRKIGDVKLWEFMEGQKIGGQIGIHIPDRKAPAPNDILANIRYSKVEISPPSSSNYEDKITLWAVYVKEEMTSNLEYEPVEWMLLTTVSVNSILDAKKIIKWYSGRWGIEVYHKVLKSGCKIENRQLAKAKRLKACLGIDMVVGWRLYHLTMLGREIPDSPCTVFFADDEWKALYCYAYRTPDVPEKPIKLSKAIRLLAKMGGYLDRNSDEPPGIKVLWRGIQKLDIATEMYKVFKDKPPP